MKNLNLTPDHIETFHGVISLIAEHHDSHTGDFALMFNRKKAKEALEGLDSLKFFYDWHVYPVYVYVSFTRSYLNKQAFSDYHGIDYDILCKLVDEGCILHSNIWGTFAR